MHLKEDGIKGARNYKDNNIKEFTIGDKSEKNIENKYIHTWMNESGCSAGNDKVTNSVKCEVLKCQCKV